MVDDARCKPIREVAQIFCFGRDYFRAFFSRAGSHLSPLTRGPWHGSFTAWYSNYYGCYSLITSVLWVTDSIKELVYYGLLLLYRRSIMHIYSTNKERNKGLGT
jgi:hypothetical protein